MKKHFIFSFLFALILCADLKAQNVYEIFISSYANGRELKDVNFDLYSDGAKMVEQQSKNGTFQFIIMEGDKPYRLKIFKDGYVVKIIQFNSPDYPFINEYEIQEIDVEFNKSKSPEDESELGELKWSSLGYVFNVVAVDSTEEYVKQNYVISEKSLGKIYVEAIENGDELYALEQFKYALSHYDIALLAKVNDKYATDKIAEIKKMDLTTPEVKSSIDKETMDKINKGEIVNVPNSNQDGEIIYSVQLGAFSGKIKQTDFQDIPDFTMIPYDDFTRVFSGEFKDINLAIQRKNDMVSKGYKDAWIVQMKGNKHIGF